MQPIAARTDALIVASVTPTPATTPLAPSGPTVPRSRTAATAMNGAAIAAGTVRRTASPKASATR